IDVSTVVVMMTLVWTRLRVELQVVVAVCVVHGLRRRRVPIVDRPPARLLRERRVRAIAEPLHVDLLTREREAMTLELREIEHLAHETLESTRLLGDPLERLGPDHRVLREPLAERVDVPATRRERRPRLV